MMKNSLDITTISADCPVCGRPVPVAVRRDGKQAVTLCCHCDRARFVTETVDGWTKISVSTGKANE